jgi:hypothetical protein
MAIAAKDEIIIVPTRKRGETLSILPNNLSLATTEFLSSEISSSFYPLIKTAQINT